MIGKAPVTDRIIPINNLDRLFKLNIQDRDQVKIKDPNKNILIYTDGSKHDKDRTGFGIHFHDNKFEQIKEPMNGYNDIYQCESVAITK